MKFYPVLLLLTTAVACGPGPAKQEPTPEENSQPVPATAQFPAGQVLDSLSLREAKNGSYALYLPQRRSEPARALIFFDPHGNGNFPLRLYQDLADEYGCILLGSNDSRNGLALGQTQSMANDLVQEAKIRFGAKEVALCGFSGGAKVALYSVNNSPQIKKVIYCGAAMGIQPRPDLKLLGFAGTRDMNYTDLVVFDWQLRQSFNEHYLVEWAGDHRFPKAEVFRDAFDFLYAGFVTDYASKQVSISPAEVQKEQQAKNRLVEAFQTKDLRWWKMEVEKLEAAKEQSVMSERLLGFISLACYSLGNQALEANELARAEKIIGIYRLADPENEAHEEFAERLREKRS